MNGAWRDEVLNDKAVSAPAKQLARIISDRFGATRIGYAHFYDTDVAAFVELKPAEIRYLRYELERKGWLEELRVRGNGRPSFRLTFAVRPIPKDADEDETIASQE